LATGPEGTNPAGINDAGQIVGAYWNGTEYQGYLDTGGVFTTISDPLSAGFQGASGINNAGQIVGWYVDAFGNINGYLYSGGIFTTVDDALGTDTEPLGINSAGQIVGFYASGNSYGFLATETSSSPEPATFAMALTALLGMAGYRARKRFSRS